MRLEATASAVSVGVGLLAGKTENIALQDVLSPDNLEYSGCWLKNNIRILGSV